jgi:hypothetical protein
MERLMRAAKARTKIVRTRTVPNSRGVAWQHRRGVVWEHFGTECRSCFSLSQGVSGALDHVPSSR